MKVIEIQNRVGDFHSLTTLEMKSNKTFIFDKWLSDVTVGVYRKISKY